MVGKSVSIASTVDYVRWVAQVHVFEDDSDIGMRIVQKNSGGTTVHTAADAVKLDIGVYSVAFETTVHNSATQLNVQVAGLDATTDFWVDLVNYYEIQAPIDGDCDERAEARRIQFYSECLNEGGEPTGNCTGFPDVNMPGGCKIECILTCLDLSENPAEVQCLG